MKRYLASDWRSQRLMIRQKWHRKRTDLQIPALRWVSIRVKTGILVSALLERGLTEAQPRTIKVGRTYQGGFSANSRVPFIRKAGRWLADAGFSEGDVVQVTVAPGKIRLKWQGSSYGAEQPRGEMLDSRGRT